MTGYKIQINLEHEMEGKKKISTAKIGKFKSKCQGNTRTEYFIMVFYMVHFNIQINTSKSNIFKVATDVNLQRGHDF